MTVALPEPPALPNEVTALAHRMRLPYLRRAASEVCATARWPPRAATR